MIQSPHVRFSDRSDLVTANRSDFILRRDYTKGQRLYTLSIMSVMIALGVAILVYNDTLMGSVLCFLLGCIMLFIAKLFENNRNMLLATEFLNALLSSALGIHYLFCMIAKPDGEIVYLDRPFQSQFPHFLNQPERTLDALLSMYNLSSEVSQRIKTAVAQGKTETLSLNLQSGKDKTPQPMLMEIEPIPRPSGYVLLRGKKAA